MKNLGLIFFGSLLVNNILLVEQIGVCPFLHLASVFRRALATGVFMSAVMILSALVNWILYHWVMMPLAVGFLKNIFFILTIIAVNQGLGIVGAKLRKIKDFLPSPGNMLVTANCLLLAGTLLVIRRDYSLSEGAVYALGGGLGFILVALVFIPIRERLESAPVNPAFRGMPIYLITLSLMALTLLGWAGFLGLE